MDIPSADLFNTEKKKYMNNLYMPDKSRKGFVDEQIIYLINFINKDPDCYTTSSCAGRISLICTNNNTRKDLAEWYYTSHKLSIPEKVIIGLHKYTSESHNNRSELWFKLDSPIFHICTRTIEKANEILRLAYSSGLKRSGIISISNKGRIIVGIMTGETIETIIAKENNALVDELYISTLVNLGNEKLTKAREKIKRFYDNYQDKINSHHND